MQSDEKNEKYNEKYNEFIQGRIPAILFIQQMYDAMDSFNRSLSGENFSNKSRPKDLELLAASKFLYCSEKVNYLLQACPAFVNSLRDKFPTMTSFYVLEDFVREGEIQPYTLPTSPIPEVTNQTIDDCRQQSQSWNYKKPISFEKLCNEVRAAIASTSKWEDYDDDEENSMAESIVNNESNVPNIIISPKVPPVGHHSIFNHPINQNEEARAEQPSPP